MFISRAIYLKLAATRSLAEAFITNQTQSIRVDRDLPLISNLDMLENIALIKEFHEKLSRKKAQQLALRYLKSIGKEDLGKLRTNKLSPQDVFYIMLIRAFMYPSQKIIVSYFFTICHDCTNMQEIAKNIAALPGNKEIIFVDLELNKNSYEDLPCDTIT